MEEQETENKKAVEMVFTAKEPVFEDAAREYEQIWQQDGPRIIEVYEEITGLKFPEQKIEAEVYLGPSYAGLRTEDKKMRLRAMYRDGKQLSVDIKRSDLTHELGHRCLTLNRVGKNNPLDLNSHQILDLVLYDVWVKLYGQEFADSAMKDEFRLKNDEVSYKDCWDWALAMSFEQRQKAFQVLKEYQKHESLEAKTGSLYLFH